MKPYDGASPAFVLTAATALMAAVARTRTRAPRVASGLSVAIPQQGGMT